MIFESSYWKEDIRKIAGRMRTRSTQKRWTERSVAKFEKDVFIGFYAIRKFIEAQKLSAEVLGMQIPSVWYPTTGKGVTRFNSHRIDELFDLKQAKRENLNLQFVCNQIIHSYLFLPLMNENQTLSGIMFCSDYERNKKLFEIGLSVIIACFESIDRDEPTELHAFFDGRIGDYRVTLLSGGENGVLDKEKQDPETRSTTKINVKGA